MCQERGVNPVGPNAAQGMSNAATCAVSRVVESNWSTVLVFMKRLLLRQSQSNRMQMRMCLPSAEKSPNGMFGVGESPPEGQGSHERMAGA